MPDLPVGTYGEDLINYMTGHLSPLFEAISSLLLHLLRGTYVALASLQPLAMVAVLALVALIATRRPILSLTLGALLAATVGMGLWEPTLQTMASVIVASAIALAVGIPIGIASAFNTVVRALVQPVLDFMQTLPVFVYLLPTILFFGIGEVPGVVATLVFSIPPAVRLTQLGIRQVDPDIVEASRAFGAGRLEVLREIQLPLAWPSIMAGVNQVIMLALSMVVVAGLVGSGGLGEIVVSAVQSLNIALSIEGGLAVVFLAIYLDRVTAALGGQGRGRPSWWPGRRATSRDSSTPPAAITTPERSDHHGPRVHAREARR
jgi:glycine betaine/proline transport system permease protein